MAGPSGTTADELFNMSFPPKMKKGSTGVRITRIGTGRKSEQSSGYPGMSDKGFLLLGYGRVGGMRKRKRESPGNGYS